RPALTLRAIGIALLVAWSVGPVLVGVMTSLETQKEAQQVPARWVPSDPNTEYYSALLGGEATSNRTSDAASDASEFPHAFVNTVLLTVASTVVVLLIAVLAGYGFSRLRFTGSRPLFWLVLATMIIPVFTLVVALYRLLAEFDLIDSFLGLVLVFVATTSPLAIWLFYNYTRELPPEPEESALIDGCTRFQAFRKVVLPQMTSGIAALTAIVMLAVWGQFLIPLLLSSSVDTKPVTVVITEFIGKYTTNYPLLTAAGILAMIPPAIVALVLNRHIRGMLSAGG
ncbi:MAG: carbohydrate ABC transporter permease, partial [Solirubrobacterales bacterium]